MQRKAKQITILLGSLALVLNLVAVAQEHDHSAHATQSKSSTPAEDNDIFCPTMKTGQLCTHGTTNVLAVSAANQARWVEVEGKKKKKRGTGTGQMYLLYLYM